VPVPSHRPTPSSVRCVGQMCCKGPPLARLRQRTRFCHVAAQAMSPAIIQNHHRADDAAYCQLATAVNSLSNDARRASKRRSHAVIEIGFGSSHNAIRHCTGSRAGRRSGAGKLRIGGSLAGRPGGRGCCNAH
jgi:hypothetical protein